MAGESREQSDEVIVLQTVLAVIGAIFNLVLLWLFKGHVSHQERVTPIRKILIYPSYAVLISSFLYCFCSLFAENNIIYGHQMTTTLCEVGFLFDYSMWTLQRYFSYVFLLRKSGNNVLLVVVQQEDIVSCVLTKKKKNNHKNKKQIK